LAALWTEFRRRRDLMATVRTGPFERGCTFLAEFRPRSIVVLTLGAVHQQP